MPEHIDRAALAAQLDEMEQADLCEATPAERDGYRQAVREPRDWLSAPTTEPPR
jgi:hypothetical protein